MNSLPDPEQNFQWLSGVLSDADLPQGSLVVLPECFASFGAGDKSQLSLREPETGGRYFKRLSDLSQQLGCHLFAGTFPLQCDKEKKFLAACRYFDCEGIQQAIYNKIHLFDVVVEDKTGQYLESKYTEPGDQIVIVNIHSLRVGIAVCYDLRFPGLFDAMEEIDLLVLPSAFTQKTGAAHWHTLIRARAIEKQCFVIAANQTGTHANGRQTYGHSMIVSPWGDILAERSELPGIVQYQADPVQINRIRRAMPIATHKKFRSYFDKSG